MLDRLVQPKKAELPMDVTLLRIVMLVGVDPKNHKLPMLVLPIAILVRLVPENAPLPILTTPLPIVMVVKPEQSWKA
jgi:hypothetical protein